MRMTSEGVRIIAEIGVNHNGSVELAKRLIEAAAAAGADYAKFQSFRAGDLALASAPMAGYQKASSSGRDQLDLLAGLELSHESFTELFDYCREVGIGFLTTAHDLGSAEFVFGLKADFIKIPSGDITNFPFLEKAGAQGKPVLLSTGASFEEEVLDAIGVLESQGVSREQITVMQCTTEYPAPLRDANLLAMVEMGAKFGVPIGYSDHTLGFTAALAAVALGAEVLEKHITLDRNMLGPDHRASLEPDEFAQMVGSIRDVELSLGVRRKAVMPSERSNRAVIRKSVVATRLIATGEKMTPDNLGVMRPGDGLSPMRWPEVNGRISPRAYEPFEKIVEL